MCYTETMHPAPVKLRRARRTDFVAVMKVLASNDAPVPAPDRATLRRFRHLVADLGVDFYVAVAAEHVVGFVHVTYARQLGGAARARVEALAVQRDYHGRGVGSALLEMAGRRAHRRGCEDLRCEADDAQPSFAEFLSKKGWVRKGQVLRFGPLAGAVEAAPEPGCGETPS